MNISTEEENRKITPNLESHKILEEKVNDELHQHGFMTWDMTYHDKLEPDVQNKLRCNQSYTSLAIRAKSDRGAVHNDREEIVFLYEFKTHSNPKYNDLTLELFPVFIHLGEYENVLTNCLYIYWNPYEEIENQREVGFWMEPEIFPEVAFCNIPRRYEDKEQFFRESCEYYFPNARINMVENNNYSSNDPYLVIKKSEIDGMEDWRDCICNKFRINNWDNLINVTFEA